MGLKDESSGLEDWLARSSGVVGIVFTDIVESTILLHRLRTQTFSIILGAYQSRAVQAADICEGRVIDRVGDELLAIFGNAANAYRFAAALIRDSGHPQLDLRAGVHYGKVQAHDGRVVGRSVHVAARVMDHGHGHELWVSDDAKAALEGESAELASTINWITKECG